MIKKGKNRIGEVDRKYSKSRNELFFAKNVEKQKIAFFRKINPAISLAIFNKTQF
jgi:hypothetical protein